MSELLNSLIELIRRTSAEIPDDVHKAILTSLENEKKDSLAQNALKIVDQNIALAKNKSQPICQDTGSILFYVDCPVGYDQITFAETAREAVKAATKKGYLRQNSVDSLTGKNDGTNCGPGAPAFHFHQHRSNEIAVRLALKGGGCENVGAQYSLPDDGLHANRDLDGCRKAILDAVFLYTELESVIAEVRVTNEASRRVLARCGFQYEGSGMCARPAFNDVVAADCYRLTRSLWASLKGWRAPLPHGRLMVVE